MTSNKQAQREAKQLFRLCMKDQLLDEDRIRQVVRYVIAAGHRDGAAILARLLRLVRLDRAQHTASVESATPLPADLQAAIQAGLAHTYGSGLTTTFAQRTSLIGGVRIQVGADVYDGSILARLAALERSL
jgi:F-type H+-transporting ATPase subunit delta